MQGLTFDHLLFIFKGAGWTILLSMMGFAGGALLGLPLALARAGRRAWLSRAAGVFISVVQGVPLPVIMFIVYFGISATGFDLPALVAAGLALTAYAGAYLGEIWKGCIQAVPRTQWEAADCLALTPVQTAVYVILPQAWRIAIPPTVGFLVQVVKNSSYAVVIGFFDLTYSSRVVNNSTFEPFIVFSIAALVYFAMCYPLSRLAARMEQRYKRG
ncbi:amino acid ABC transporter permease [Noviherbaspirillum galbum]|uniref:Amino acid ABC transporter permease n=1 Tax=Noviherbaspirillum galbum TaxID=2709383 RepID=A0A6B3SL85_9BURK|nr:amino acid ABC transporter permease [Noviherbaspirillum galbum]NEX61258.1 amino acid ABC transporter permease [Noviherbaspirillum galbum]